jgi:hypothetical protein
MTRRRRFDDPWEISDVGGFLTAVGSRVELDVGLDVIAVVDTSDARELLAAEALPSIAGRLEGEEASWTLSRRVLAPAMRRLCPQPVPSEHGARCSVHIVRCRDGRVVSSPDDVRLGYAVMYANNGLRTYMGEIFTLTPHGWCDFDRGGAEPTLTQLRGRRLRAV